MRLYSFSKYREQYRENLRLAIPVMLSQLGHIIVQVADNAMVGHYGGEDPVPLAAAAFGGGIFFLTFIAMMGITFGITPIVGELYAQKREVESTKYLQNGLLLFGALSIVATALQYLLIPLMWRMGQPDEVVAAAIPYFKTLTWSLIPVVIFFVIKQFLEGLGNTKVAMCSVILSNVVNIILNYLLIGGELGAPELGVLGAGIATLTSRIVMAAAIIVYFATSRKMLKYRELFARVNFSKSAVRRLVTMGLPISLQIFLEASTFIVIGFMFGQFGAAAIGANQIGITLGNCSFMIIVAIGSATTIRISHCYGQRDFAQLKLASYAAYHLAALWNISAAILYFSLRHHIPMIFSSNEEIIRLASIFVVAIVAYQIPDGVQCISVGILRGMQDVKRIPFIALFSYWLCNIPVAYLCAFHLGMGESGLYMGFVVGFATAALLLILRIRYRYRSLTLDGK